MAARQERSKEGSACERRGEGASGCRSGLTCGGDGDEGKREQQWDKAKTVVTIVPELQTVYDPMKACEWAH